MSCPASQSQSVSLPEGPWGENMLSIDSPPPGGTEPAILSGKTSGASWRPEAMPTHALASKIAAARDGHADSNPWPGGSQTVIKTTLEHHTQVLKQWTYTYPLVNQCEILQIIDLGWGLRHAVGHANGTRVATKSLHQFDRERLLWIIKKNRTTGGEGGGEQE